MTLTQTRKFRRRRRSSATKRRRTSLTTARRNSRRFRARRCSTRLIRIRPCSRSATATMFATTASGSPGSRRRAPGQLRTACPMRCRLFRRARRCTTSATCTFTIRHRILFTWATRRATSAHTDITELWSTELAGITGHGSDRFITTRVLTLGDSTSSTIRGPADGDSRSVTARRSST